MSTDDRMVDVLGKLVAQLRSDFVLSFPVMTVGGCEALQVRYSLDVPYEDVWHLFALVIAVHQI